MYDSTKVIKCHKMDVQAMINRLSKYPLNAEVTICGDTQFYFHMEQDQSVVNLDTESLDENYPDIIDVDNQAACNLSGDIMQDITDRNRIKFYSNPDYNIPDESDLAEE